MRIRTILGGVASSAVIGAMAVIYMTASELAHAAADPTELIAVAVHDPARLINLEPNFAVRLDVPRPQHRPARITRLPDSVHNESEQYCLAQNIFWEARGESRIGQEAVAWVTLNRVLDPRWPGTVCRVVWQSRQFSWTHERTSHQPPPSAAWDRAQSIAARVSVSYDRQLDPTEGSVMFHANWVRPSWSTGFDRVVQIGAHIFYR